MVLSIVFRCVKNLYIFDCFMITKVSCTYLFYKRGGSVKVSKEHFSTSSITRFANTDEMGEPMTVAKTCMWCFLRKVKYIAHKQISCPVFRFLVM